MPGLLQRFQKYKGCKIAIYGLSIETEKVLDEINKEFSIVGLLDGYKSSGVFYGKKIISIEEAIEYQVKLILVVARPGSCRAIAKKIGNLCVENDIVLLDIKGKNLCDQPKIIYDFKQVLGITKKRLFQMVKDKEAVSFDLFDTLIMRQVLFPTDVFELVAHKLKKKGIFINNFCEKRVKSEKNLSRKSAPTLMEIYAYMIKTYSIREIQAKELALIEWNIDQELLVPRQEMCEFVRQVIDAGKHVYIVSDTYYTKHQVACLLDKCGVYGYKDILASCEYQTGKTQQLFEKLKNILSGKVCIHIGDDLVADVESAQKNGIEFCQIYSGIELLKLLGYLGFGKHVERMSDRIKVGMFVSRLFNSPFQFEEPDRKICVKNSYDIGYLFFAPIITDFVLWFSRQVEKEHMQNVWFCARDGYLIKSLYEELTKNTSSIYFLTSRVAAVRAGIENEKDITYVGEMNFSGSLEEQLKKRFGLSLNTEKSRSKLIDYTQEILESSKVDRRNYKTYIDKLEIAQGDIAFFDFVAKGTSQMLISRLITNHMRGYYFLLLEEEYMKERGIDIVPFYEQGEQENSAVLDNYYILETILTSPMPSIEGFDSQGNPRYVEETRKEGDIRCFQNAQEGILQYFKRYLKLCGEFEIEIDKKIDELFLLLIHNISILDKDFLGLIVEDPFFNRMTDMMDLI